MNGLTTPTGIPLIDCELCGKNHPETRRHCTGCNTASLFLYVGKCGPCRRKVPA